MIVEVYLATSKPVGNGFIIRILSTLSAFTPGKDNAMLLIN